MKSKKVLIVDDNDLNRKLFENLIGHLYSFRSVKNGLEAIAATEADTYDLILMDIQMPLMDGITAMKRIRQAHPEVCPILAVTAYSEESDRESFLEEGFDEFITKPIRPREFLKIIQGYLNQPEITQATCATTDNQLPETLDKKILRQLLKYNSHTVIGKVLEDFMAECRETETQIDRYILNSDSAELLEKIHTIKGNSGTLGAMRIYCSAVKAEESCRSNMPGSFYQEVCNLKNQITHFREFLKQETIFDT